MTLGACSPNKDKADELFKAGKRKVLQNDPEGAMKDFNAAIEINDQLDQAWYHRANLKYNLRDYDGAYADYDRCIEINPSFADAYANRGNIKFERGDREGACQDWNIAKDLGKEMTSRLLNCP